MSLSDQLTLSYMTCRRDCRIEWFYDAIVKQAEGDMPKIIVVDFYREERDTTQGIWQKIAQNCKHVSPMPSAWQGPHRLTKENWFDASSSRQSSLCLCDTPWLAYSDDISVPMPGWLVNVKQSMRWNGVTLGAYRKVKDLVVKDGEVVSFTDHPQGRDNRWSHGSNSGAVNCNGDMLYGCSLLAPVERLLCVGGWPTGLCSGLGFEDVLMGMAMANTGTAFRYNRNMLTLESEELHSAEPAFRRESFASEQPPGKDWAALNMVKRGAKFFPNNYEGGIRKLREEVLAGKPFPLPNITHDWYTKKPLSEL